MAIKKIKLIHISVFLLICDFLALIFLGKTYTKFLVFDIYAHDLLLTIITILCFFEFDWKRNRLYSIEILIILSLLYLIVSFIRNDFDVVNKGYIILRQYAIFGYLAFFYVITKKLMTSSKAKEYTIKALYVFGIVCIVLQFVHIINLYVNTNLLQIIERNAYSPMVVMGFFVFISFVFTRDYLNQITKFFISVFVILLSISIGHDSAYLGILLIGISYIFIISNKKTKIAIAFTGILMMILILLFLPTFSDHNAQWRLIYWEHILSRSLSNYLFLGEGFGVQYASNTTIESLNNLMLSNGYNALILEDEKYLTAPHNSFLSMILHTGIPSIIFLLIPFRTIFIIKNVVRNRNILFLVLSLIGMTVWASFNVVLELPHSSSIFWIVYFLLSLSLKKTNLEQARKF